MRVVIRTFQQQGDQRIATDRSLSTERLRLGRGTDQDVQVPDLRAALAHAEILADRRGPLLLAKSDNGVWVNGTPVESAKLDRGDVIEIGRFRLEVIKAERDEELILGFEEGQSQSAELAARKAALRTRLPQAGLSQRRNAWILALLLLVLCLLLPLGLRYAPSAQAKTEATPRQQSLARSGAFDDSLWLSGPVSSVHRFFVEDCGSCHVQPFVQVQDSACLNCHEGMRQHSDDPQVLAHASFSGQTCTSCHREHNGPHGVNADAPQLCVDCHAKPERDYAGLELAPASSFARAHPEFAPRVSRFEPATRKFQWNKVRQAPATLHEDTKLIYPHDLHLAPKGIDAPAGRVVMKCGDCHQPDSRGISFEPVTMEKHCAGCHRLDFDPDDPDRVLPHGRPDQILGQVRDYYASKALQGGVRDPEAPRVVQSRRRPGEVLTPVEARAALAWADRRAQRTLRDVFERRTCHYCHAVQRSNDPVMPWSIAPVMLAEHALDHARFDHAAHRSETCESCHAAPRSGVSADVLLPDLASCRECHGDVRSDTQVPSPCSQCHAFHMASRRYGEKTTSDTNVSPLPRAGAGPAASFEP